MCHLVLHGKGAEVRKLWKRALDVLANGVAGIKCGEISMPWVGGIERERVVEVPVVWLFGRSGCRCGIAWDMKAFFIASVGSTHLMFEEGDISIA